MLEVPDQAGRLGAMKSKHRGDRGVEIATALFPELKPEPEGTWWNMAGIDGFLDDEAVQIKYDSAITRTGNIYHEIYEKTAGRPDQPWRVAIGKVKWYIFTTETDTEILALKVTVNRLAEIESGKPLTPISPNYGDGTSMGYLIPYHELRGLCELRRRSKPVNKVEGSSNNHQVKET